LTCKIFSKIVIFIKTFQLLIGAVTNILAYVPVFVLVQFFRRTGSRRGKSMRLKEKIETMSSHVESNRRTNVQKRGKTNSFIAFPWWLKIILYFVSFTLMTLSICLVAFKGKCNKDIVFSISQWKEY
jgi:hypothetical protein